MAAKTRYVILREIEPGETRPGTWEQLVGEYEASSSEDAKKAAAAKLGLDSARMVAIPVGSWRPAKVAVEIETKVTVVYEKAKRARRPAAAATG